MGSGWRRCSSSLFVQISGARARGLRWSLSAVGWLGTMAIHGMPLPQPKGLALTFVMAATFSLYVVLTAELDRTESFLTNLFYSALGVFVPLTLALPLWWQPLTSRALAGGAVVGILGWLTLAGMDLALRCDRPSRLAIFLFSQIVAQEFLSALLGTALLATAAPGDGDRDWRRAGRAGPATTVRRLTRGRRRPVPRSPRAAS